MAEQGPDGRFLPGNQASAGRSEPITPAGWRPPRGYSWKSFEPGVAQVHGAMTERITAPLVRQRVEDLLQLAEQPDSQVGYLMDPSYAAAIEGWARSETQARLVADWLEREGLHDEKGRLRPEVDVRRRLDEQAANARARLGLDPMSRSKLFGNLAEASRDRAAAEAHAELQERYGRPVVVDVPAQDERSGDAAAPESSGHFSAQAGHQGAS